MPDCDCIPINNSNVLNGLHIMTEQQKQAVDADVKDYLYQFVFDNGDQEAEVKEHYTEGLKEVINHPERYGLQPINEWVSVKDRLPNKAELILAYQNGEIYTSFYDGLFRVGFTHWQPLPPIPDVEPK